MVPISIITTTASAEPTTEPSSTFIDFLLAGLRCAGLRARIITNEIEAMATALSAGIVTPETALLHLHASGAAGLIPTSSAVVK